MTAPCPNPYERLRVQCEGGLFSEPISGAACLGCALERKAPPCGYSYPLLVGLFHSIEDRSQEIHVTDLVTCLAKAYWSKTAPAALDLKGLLTLTIGKALHLWVETAMLGDPHFQAEVAVEKDGLVGRIDFLGNGQIIDLKTTSWLAAGKEANLDHQDQLNIYALWADEGCTLWAQYVDKYGASVCRSCRIAYRLVDGVPTCPGCGGTSSKAHNGAQLSPVAQRDRQAVERFAMLRKAILENALALGEPPDPEPGWLCGKYCPYTQCKQNGRHDGRSN
ncbi:MAG: hypothetical protein ACKOC5_13580 [Chloroflexota bacterium]